MQMETVVELVNKCPCLVNLLVSGFSNSINLSPFLIDPSILKHFTSLKLDDCIYNSESLIFWSRSCINLKSLNISFLDTSKLIDSDIENLLFSCKKLTSFSTNYPVKSGILNIISKNNRKIKNLVFYSNEFFSLDLVANFKAEMKVLSDFGFVINKSVGMIFISYDDTYSFTSFSGGKAAHLYSDSEAILFQQYLALFRIPAQCQIVHFYEVPIYSETLNKLINANIQFKKLGVFSCNIASVMDSLREVFQKCKQLISFHYSDNQNLMTAEHLRSLFSQQTTLQVIEYGCNPNITSSSLKFMVQNSPLLTELRLYNTKGLDLTTLRDYMDNTKSYVKFTMQA
jgi:hypothetical protein